MAVVEANPGIREKAKRVWDAARQALLAQAKALRDPVLWGMAVWHLDGNPDRPYRLKGWEFLREPLNCRAAYVAIQKSAQCGITEGFMMRAIAEADMFGKSVIYNFEKDEKAYANVKRRIDTNIEIDPYLQSRCDNSSLQQKRVGMGWVYFQGAQNMTKATSTPADVVIKDERDLMPNLIAENLKKRLKASTDPFEADISNPTFPKVGINGLYLAGDQREWCVRCPHCKFYDPMRWASHVTEDGKVLCPLCRRDFDRLAPGIWVPGITEVKLYPSYHINGLQTVVCDVAKIQKDCNSKDPIKRRAAINMDKGEAFMDKTAGLDFEDVQKAAGSWKSKPIAPGGYMAVDPGGVFDVQIYRPRKGDVMECVYSGFVSGFDELEELEKSSGVRFGTIDAGPELDGAKKWCAKRKRRWKRVGYTIHDPKGKLFYEDAADPEYLHANRTQLADYMTAAVRNKEILFPVDDANDPESRLVEHLTSPRRLLERDDEGEINVIWFHEPANPDHQFHCTMYAYLVPKAILGRNLLGALSEE